MEAPKLIYYTDEKPGYTRHKWGRGFIYKDEQGNKIKDEITLKRIKGLVIPPVWENVWICPDETGHLQCTGEDLKRRKQYIYHPLWMEYVQENKFSRLQQFGYKLPLIRKKIETDLEEEDWSKRKVLALVVHILDEYYLRIGNQYYADKNQTYGLTTLRRKHIEETSEILKLNYKAKSNKQREIEIDDPLLTDLIKEMSDLPGYEIFRYKDENSKWHNIDSNDVNLYIKDMVKENFTAKDFRTWGGTKLAVSFYDRANEKIKNNKRLEFIPTLVKLVAAELGNTPATCRDYYIHPEILEWLSLQEGKLSKSNRKTKGLDESEKIVMDILEN
ncbi:MAG: DNA topoisomerase IB [Fulvivirga sp.]|nr:DNA topoisomerase IB [Fulvivirga sp.]